MQTRLSGVLVNFYIFPQVNSRESIQKNMNKETHEDTGEMLYSREIRNCITTHG